MSGGFGPGFQGARSRLYRAEYVLISLAIFAYLIWRSVTVGGVDWFQTLFWLVFPDIVSFVPIGATSKRREWPPWGANLYNASHSILTWGLGLVLLSVGLGSFYWPLLGWLIHITGDRAAGYALRASSAPDVTKAD